MGDSDSVIQTDPVLMSLKEGYQRPNQLVFKAPVKEKKSVVVNGIDLLENVPPRTENEVCEEVMLGITLHHCHSHFTLKCHDSLLFPSQLLRMFFRQQDELRRLKEELTTKDVRIRQLELELNNLKNVSPNNVWPLGLSVDWRSCFLCLHFLPPMSFWAPPPALHTSPSPQCLLLINHISVIPSPLHSAYDNIITPGSCLNWFKCWNVVIIMTNLVVNGGDHESPP